jgi:alanine dehydrogenase
MKPGSVLVDISIDQGAVPHTSTYALTSASLPCALQIANRGWREALRHDDALARGLNTCDATVASVPVSDSHDLPFTPLPAILA